MVEQLFRIGLTTPIPFALVWLANTSAQYVAVRGVYTKL